MTDAQQSLETLKRMRQERSEPMPTSALDILDEVAHEHDAIAFAIRAIEHRDAALRVLGDLVKPLAARVDEAYNILMQEGSSDVHTEG